MRASFVVIVHNLRSAHNVGSVFRTADGAGAEKLYLTGITPCPARSGAAYHSRAEKALAKTALGAERTIPWEKKARLGPLLDRLESQGYALVALEQSPRSIDYRDFRPSPKTALILGNEVRGLDRSIVRRCTAVLEIPMRGTKNSLNVSVAFGIASYHIAGRMETRPAGKPARRKP